MAEIADTIVAKRLVRNLRYRLTYTKVFESFLESEAHPEVLKLLQALIDAQSSAIEALSGYLPNLGVAAQDLPFVKKLLDHAANQADMRSRLRFARYGLAKAVSWYKEQLMDRKMTADPELREILLQLGELEAASLWRIRATMTMLGIRDETERQKSTLASHSEPARARRGRSRRVATAIENRGEGRGTGRGRRSP
ncbi:MAG: hypothetical protein PVI67_16680 [Anaerolineae bacterium]|jgi:hypothetical protein